MTPVTIYLLIVFFPFFYYWMISKKIRNRSFFDYLIIFHAFWVLLALYVYQGIANSIEPIGTAILQTTGAFAVGRVLVRDKSSALYLTKVLAIAMILLFPAVLAESLTRRPFFLELASVAGPTVNPVMMDPRMGLRRAQGLFEHPILFGIFSASILSFVVFSYQAQKKRAFTWLSGTAITLCSILSLSTGALLSLNVQFGLWIWRKIFRSQNYKWLILSSIITVLYILVDIFSTKSPFHVFVNRLTFSSGSSYNRILIWQFGTAEVARHPFFGIGLGEWERPGYMSSSMDNFWLVQAVRYGLPALLSLAGALILILLRMGRSKSLDEISDKLRTGLTFSILATAVAIGSVHLWNNSFIWFMFLMGCAGFLASGKRDQFATARKSPRK